ncbi:MAG: ankyrin repeat domain-containing protein, partial [Opitutales bacterium]
MFSGHLDELSKIFGVKSKKIKGVTIRAKDGVPFISAQRGQLTLFLFAAPSAMDSPVVEEKEKLPDISNRLRDMAGTILKLKEDVDEAPDSPLATHLSRPYDLSLFLDYSNFVRFAQRYAPDDQFARLLNALHVFDGSLSLASVFYNGGFSIKAKHLPTQGKNLFSGKVDKELALQLPGEAIGVGGLSLDRSVLKQLSIALGSIENETTEKEGDATSSEPKSELQSIQALDALSGDFVFALTRHRKAVPMISSGALPSWTSAPAAFFIGAKIGDPRQLDLMLSFAKKNNLFDYFIASSGLSFERTDKHFFITTADHRRELMAGKPLRKLAKKELAVITKGPVSARLDLRRFAESLRKAIVPHYKFLMAMDVLEEFDKIVLSSDEDGELILRVSLRDKKQNALLTLAKRWETEFSDRRNAGLFRAIAANDLRLVDQQIRMGALVNAPDRSGHTPMHYAAYRGTVEVFEYLLRNGGRINVLGRDQGTPLHSAVWGRNEEVVKVLLENGAEVNVRSDEGETPAMTAALRGEQEILEILLSLAADPKARDKYDTGLLELAAAGGHKAIVEKLQSIGVKSKYPFHVAAGLGDEKAIRKFLADGTPIDQRDGFGS